MAWPREHEDRPVPQVQAVAAPADRDERPPAEHAPDPDGRRVDDDHHRDERQQRHEREQPLEDVAPVSAGDRAMQPSRPTATPPTGSSSPLRPAPLAAGRTPRAPDERRRGAGDETARPGERRQVQEVHPVQVADRPRAGAWSQNITTHRAPGRASRPAGPRCTAPQTRAGDGDEHQRPGEVELLLDGRGSTGAGAAAGRRRTCGTPPCRRARRVRIVIAVSRLPEKSK